MKLIIRYLGMVIYENELQQEREYIVGRDSSSCIKLTHDFISRKHAKIYFESGKWWYQDMRPNHPHFRKDPIQLGQEIIEFENDIDFLTDNLLSQHETKIYDFKDLRSLNQKSNNKISLIGPRVALAFCLVMILGGAGTLLYKNYNGKMNTNQILSFVSKRFVEFELVKNQELEGKLKKYSNLKDKDFKEEVGFCSGFIVGKGIVMTANHCLMQATGLTPMENFKLKTHDKKLHDVKRVLGFNIERDILLLEVPSLASYSTLKFAEGYEIGQKVYTIGNPHGQGLAVRDGILSSHTKDPNNPKIEYLRYSAAASPGNSGGPLVDERGKIVALVFARSNAGENYNLGTESKYLVSALEKFKDGKPQSLKIDTSKHVFGYGTLGLLGQYLLIDSVAQSALYDYPDLGEEHKNISFSVDVPSPLKDFTNHVYKSTLEELGNAASKIRAKLNEKKIRGIRWSEQVNDVVTHIEFNEHGFSNPSIAHFEEGKIFLNGIESYAPMSYSPFKYEDVKKDGYRPNYQSILVVDNKVDDLKLPLRYSSFPLMSRTQGALIRNDFWHSKIDYNFLENPSRLQIDDFKDFTLGDEGMLIDQYMVRYQFLRPKSLQSFRIKDVEDFKISEGVEEDLYGRKWKRETWNFFDQLVSNRYCLESLNGETCTVKTRVHFENEILNNHFDSKLVASLSDNLIPNDFSTPDRWSDFLSDEKKSYEYNDLKIDEKLNFETTFFGLKPKFSKDQKNQIRFSPTLVYSDGKPEWVISKYQEFTPGKRTDKEKKAEDKEKKQKYLGKLCSTVVQLPALNEKNQYNSLGKLYEERMTLKKNLKNKEWVSKKLEKMSRTPSSVEIQKYIKEHKEKIDDIKRQKIDRKWADKPIYSYSFCNEVMEYEIFGSKKKSYMVGGYL